MATSEEVSTQSTVTSVLNTIERSLKAKDEEIRTLRRQAKALDLVLQQNAALEGEVSRLWAELDEATKGVLKRGYLYKWREREISYATKWTLRYFVLQGKNLSYFADGNEHRPRRTIDLSKCIVREEGTKKRGQYYVFSIYLASISENADAAGSLLLRLSSESSAEASQWVDMLEQACAISDEDFQNFQEVMKSTDCVSSTSTHATSTESLSTVPSDNNTKGVIGDEWMIDEVPLATGNGEEQHDQMVEDPNVEKMMKRVHSSSLILKKSMSRQSFARHTLSKRSPADFSNSGTRLASLNNTNKNNSTSGMGSNNNNNKAGFVPRPPFPASKPMHVRNNFSPLSSEVRPGEQNYRGFFNLGVIILIISNFRFIVDNLARYGFLIKLPAWDASQETDPRQWDDSKPFSALLSWFISILISFSIEKMAARGILPEKIVVIFNVFFCTLNIVIPILWVLKSRSHPGASMVYMFQSVIMWMKLISYAHANRDYRRMMHQQKLAERGDPPSPKSRSKADSDSPSSMATEYNNAKPALFNVFAECKDIEAPYLTYPLNITLPNLLWFCIVPTLCYQLNYPRSPTIRWRYVFFVLLRMLAVAGLIIFSVEQYIRPTLEMSVEAMRAMNILQVLERLLKLSIPNTYVWLLGFYFYFHLWLNFLAEITRFGDRLFYKDWWNARTIETYWRTWNIPVHHWMIRHLYNPMLRFGSPKIVATFAVFFFSAVFHEVIISTPFHFYTLHVFLGMMIQAPLIFVTKFIDKVFDNAFAGNAIFWCVFCIVGQPMGIIFLFYDLWKMKGG